MNASRNWIRLSLLTLALMLVMGQSKCPDYSKPDDTGPLPAGTVPATKKYQEDAAQNPPDPLTCDVPVYQTITVSETNVTCEPTYNYATLFTQAKAIADGIAEATQCQAADCKPAHSWIERASTECQGTTAGVMLEIGLLCPRNKPKPPGLQITAATPALNGPPTQFPNPPPAPKPSIGDVKGQLATTPVTCKPVEAVQYRYREPAAGCNAQPYPFQPFADRAARRAAAVCKAVNCAAGCTAAAPPVILRTAWTCRNNNQVQVTVDVQCCK